MFTAVDCGVIRSEHIEHRPREVKVKATQMKRVKRQPLRKSLGSNKKTKLTTKKNSSSNPINSAWDEDIESSDEDDDRNNKGVEDEDEQDEEEMESADQKRKRLAKQYLESMMSYEDDSDEAGADEGSDEERGGDAISARLRKQRLEAQGKYFRYTRFFETCSMSSLYLYLYFHCQPVLRLVRQNLCLCYNNINDKFSPP